MDDRWLARHGFALIRRVGLLLAAAHGGPAIAVTVITGLLALAVGLEARTTVTLTGVVFAGQLTIGWANDLLDASRDRATGRTDKPIATGELPRDLVVAGLAVAAVLCLLLSSALPLPSAAAHLVLVVASGHAYNARLKATTISWLPYAVAFGSLPAIVTLAAAPPVWPPWWLVVAAGSLGVAAHLLNALPDLAADEATGVRGLPHRLGAASSRTLALALLLVATVAAGVGPGALGAWSLVGMGLVAALLVVAVRGRGRRPFQAAVGVALVDVAMLVAAGRAAA